ncbi:DNA-directed RNA polymerase, sigma-H factor [Lactiplantibacillus pentosus KCA1]|nr:sigma factor [Lactiplantibacillus pentosus]EIW14833.1 DNA-directed RNA polymerase, sigma-H factor [Lactiplantibacillus pentosus KCA1]
MDEQQLIALAATGDSLSIEVLAVQYQPVVWRLRQHYYVPNFETDDWYQEGRIAIYRATQKYQQAQNCPFGVYFRALLTHQIIDCIRQAQAQKRRPDGELVPLDADDEQAIVELQTATLSTLDVVYVRDQIRTFGLICSTFEGAVFADLLAGRSPESIAVHYHVEVPQVINAIDRCRKKLRALLRSAS